ncbi:MAG: PilZ domain-containing protein [Pseudomonadota bacterium]
MTEDRRQYSRYQINCGANIVCDVGRLPGTLTEISVEGLRFEMPKAPTPGTGATITLELDKAIVIRGVIQWAIEAGTAGLHYFQIGVEIDSLQLDGAVATGLGQRTHVVQEILLSLKADE